MLQKLVPDILRYRILRTHPKHCHSSSGDQCCCHADLSVGHCVYNIAVEEEPEKSGNSDDVSFSSVHRGKYSGGGAYHYVSVTLYDLWICSLLSVLSDGGGRVA